MNVSSQVVVERCQVVDEFADMYAVVKNDLSCNLVINNITMNHGGLYTCQDQLSTETPSTAKVTVHGTFTNVFHMHYAPKSI